MICYHLFTFTHKTKTMAMHALMSITTESQIPLDLDCTWMYTYAYTVLCCGPGVVSLEYSLIWRNILGLVKEGHMYLLLLWYQEHPPWLAKLPWGGGHAWWSMSGAHAEDDVSYYSLRLKCVIQSHAFYISLYSGICNKILFILFMPSIGQY